MSERLNVKRVFTLSMYGFSIYKRPNTDNFYDCEIFTYEYNDSGALIGINYLMHVDGIYGTMQSAETAARNLINKIAQEG